MVAVWPMPALAASQPNLGTAASYAVLAGSTITNTGLTTINGDVGISPGNALTGFGPGVISGTIHLADPKSLQAQADLTAAYNNAAGQAANANLTGMDLGGKTLMAGTYRFSSSAELTGKLTLDGPGVYLFQIGKTLTTASLASVHLINGATPCGVYWQVGSSATLGTGTSFQGTVMAMASITVTTGTTLVGRALARTAAVTLDTNTITTPPISCAPGSGGGGGNNVCGKSDNNNDNDNADNKIADNNNADTNNADNNNADTNNSDNNNDENDNNKNDNNKDKDRNQCKFGPFPSASTDSGTCGLTDWAQDTFNRSFTVTQNSDGTFAVREDFTKGKFTTIAGASPGACEGSSTPHGTLVAAGKKGNFHGYLAGTTTGIFNKHGCDSGGCDSTAGFIAHVFGPGAAYTCTTGVGACSFFFTYQANGQGLKFHHWINASTDLGGNRGDIATS
jgi:hypothetical protein